LDLRGLVVSIYEAVTHIDTGRKGFAIEGKEREGRISYEKGIALAMAVFKEALAAAVIRVSRKMLFTLPLKGIKPGFKIF